MLWLDLKNQKINQKIKKKSKSLILLINSDIEHASYLNEGQCSTDKHFWKLFILYTYLVFILFPVMAGLENQKVKKQNNQRV